LRYLYPILIISLLFTACESPTGSVTGTVFYGNSGYQTTPDTNASVILVKEGATMSYTTMVNASGNYKFDNIPDGDYIMIVKSSHVKCNVRPKLELVVYSLDMINSINDYKINDSVLSREDNHLRDTRMKLFKKLVAESPEQLSNPYSDASIELAILDKHLDSIVDSIFKELTEIKKVKFLPYPDSDKFRYYQVNIKRKGIRHEDTFFLNQPSSFIY
jgi:hypothetical protein